MSKKETEVQSKGPLLYIVQPNLESASGKMQKSFLLKSNKKTASYDHDGIEVLEKEPESIPKQLPKEAIEKKLPNFQTKPAASIEEDDAQEDSRSSSGVVTGVRKPFKEMDIDEKLNFLIHRPPYIPKVPCEVRTDSETIFGYVESEANGIVSVQSLSSNEMIKVKKNQIASVRMLGI